MFGTGYLLRKLALRADKHYLLEAAYLSVGGGDNFALGAVTVLYATRTTTAGTRPRHWTRSSS